LPIDLQIPEFIRDYIRLVDTEVLQSVGIFLTFLVAMIVLRRVRKVAALQRHLNDEVATLQGQVQQLLTEQRRSLTEPQARRQTAPGGGVALNPAETALKVAVMETELKALKDMVTELRQARDDWKAQAGRASPWPAPPITAGAPADAPSGLAAAPSAAPEPER
jgi:hypothetical protein